MKWDGLEAIHSWRWREMEPLEIDPSTYLLEFTVTRQPARWLF